MSTIESILESPDSLRAALTVESQYREALATLQVVFWEALEQAIEKRLKGTDLAGAEWIHVEDNPHYSEELIRTPRNRATNLPQYGLNLRIKEVDDEKAVVLMVREPYHVYFTFLMVRREPGKSYRWGGGEWLEMEALHLQDSKDTDETRIIFKNLSQAAAQFVNEERGAKIAEGLADQVVTAALNMLNRLNSEEGASLLAQLEGA